MVSGPNYDERLKELQDWQDNMLEEYGFYTHFTSDDSYPYDLNAHTHGLVEGFDHLDLQVVLPMPPESVNHIIHSIVSRIKDGKKYEPNKIYEKVIDGNDSLKILFVLAEECERKVLRVIFPGPDFVLPPTGEYKKQLEGIEDAELPTT